MERTGRKGNDGSLKRIFVKRPNVKVVRAPSFKQPAGNCIGRLRQRETIFERTSIENSNIQKISAKIDS